MDLKTPKPKKSVYEEKYKKNAVAFHTNKDLIKFLNQPDIAVWLISRGINEDGSEYLTIKIGNIQA